MFASEQVMKQYLDQLLTDDEVESPSKTDSVVESELINQAPQSHQAESEYSAKIKQRFSEAAEQQEQQNIQLKPIEQAINADKVRPVKERPKPKSNVHSLEQLLHAVSVQQQEAARELEAKQKAEALAKQKAEQQTQVPVQQAEEQAKVVAKAKVEPSTIAQVEVETKVEAVQDTQPVPATAIVEEKIEEPFQALFFEVAGLKLAVPLQDLGGIHNLTEVTSLFGKPEWFKGVMVNRERKLNVVESARWVMPEKYDEALKAKLNYKYLIMLGESDWGLAAEKLVTTQYIKPEEVKWRKQPGKRPWLFGTIKEKMCALLHVEDLIAMLEKGVDARNE